MRPSCHPCFLDLSVNDKKKWKPYYNQYTRPKALLLSPVQEDALRYSASNPILAKELEIRILDKIKISIRSWRRTSCTFNTDIGNRLRQMLEEMEEHKLNGTTHPSSSDYRNNLLSTVCRGKAAFGFPLHFGFMNIQEIIDEIEATGIHQSKHPDGEFALAVKVFPYECDVMSVWVFLCHITPHHYV